MACGGGITIMKLIISRALYVVHGIFVIWKATVTGGNAFWACVVFYPLMILDMVFFCLKGNYKNRFLKLFCPSTALYIASTLPPLLYLELERWRRMTASAKAHSYTKNVTLSPNGTQFSIVVQRLTYGDLVYFEGDSGLEMLEQLLLMVLIGARWVMPKGDLSRNELSQMLFVYTSIATDSIELFSLFKSETIAKSFNTSYTILGAWIVSLMQFTLSLYSSPRKSRGGEFRDDDDSFEEEKKTQEELDKKKENIAREKFCLLVSFFLMDAPYLIIRCYVVLVLKIITYNIIFYFCKNVLLVIFTFYRFAVIYNVIPGFEEEDEMLFYNDYMDFTDFNEPETLGGEFGTEGTSNVQVMGAAVEEPAKKESFGDESEAKSKKSRRKSKHGLHGDASEAGDVSTVSRRKSRKKSRTNLDDDGVSEVSRRKSRRKSRTNLDDDGVSEVSRRKSRRKSRTNLDDDGVSEVSRRKSRKKSRTNLDDDGVSEVSRRKSRRKSRTNLDEDGVSEVSRRKSRKKSRTNLDDDDLTQKKSRKKSKISKTVADDEIGWDPVKKD